VAGIGSLFLYLFHLHIPLSIRASLGFLLLSWKKSVMFA
jgi:hypothetical protein